MPAISYRDYILSIDKTSGTSLIYKLFVTILITCLIFLTSIPIFLLDFKEYNLVKTKNNYLLSASSGFKSIDQSLKGLVDTFKVAGAKIDKIAEVREASSSADGFFVVLDDNNKMIAKLKLIKEELNYQRSLIEESEGGQFYQELNDSFMEYYNQADNNLTDLSSEREFASEIFVTLGPNFYQPTLTNENVWRNGDPLVIKKYYESTEAEARKVLEKIINMTPPSEFEVYMQNQITYLELIINVSSNIIQILDEAESQDFLLPEKKERAYFLLNSAKIESIDLYTIIMEERLKFFDTKRNLSSFAAVNLIANSIDSKLNNFQLLDDRARFGVIYGLVDSIAVGE